MKKLVALEKVFGLFSKITYAEKHDELDFIKDWDNEIGFYRNIRTQEPFHCLKEKVGYIEQSDIFFFVEQAEKQKKYTKPQKKNVVDKSNQGDLFLTVKT